MTSCRTHASGRRATACLLALATTLGVALRAHDIPNDVTIQTFVKVDGQQLEILVRVPINAMRDVIFPQKDADNMDLDRSQSQMHDAVTLWVGDELKAYEDGRQLEPQQVLAIRATPADDRSFERYESASALLAAPQRQVDVALKTGYLDTLFAYAIQSPDARFSIDPTWARLGQLTVTIVHYVLPDGSVRSFEVQGDPGLLRLAPSWFQVAERFVAQGFRHILDGVDHLLFLLCLVIPFRRVLPLLGVVAAFAASFSISLVASAYGFGPDTLWFSPLVTTLVALSIVYVALENVVGPRLHQRWLIAFGFGLAHGFAFSSALKPTLQFAGAHTLTSVLSFDAGIDVGLLLAVGVVVPALRLLFSTLVPERLGTIVVSAIVTHTAWHWLSDRYSAFRQYDLTPPPLTPAFIAELLRYAMAIVALAGILWAISLLTRRRGGEQAASGATGSGL